MTNSEDRDNEPMLRRGIVWISPTDSVPTDLMADPATSNFCASWEHDEEGALENVEIVGAEQAIKRGKARATRIRIRLGHTDKTYFSAGEVPEDDLPPWPPEGVPPRGWWRPGDPRTPPPSPAEQSRIGVTRPAVVRTERPPDHT